VFENRVLRGIFGPKRGVERKNYIMRSLMICTPHPIFLGDQMEKHEMGGTCSTIGEGRCVYRVLV